MPTPPTLHDKAADDLQFIRRTMEQAGQFTAVPGWGLAVTGVLALAAAWLASRQDPASFRWLMTWLVAAGVAVFIGGLATLLKARRAGLPFFTGPAQRYITIFLLPVAAGAILTQAFVRNGLNDRLTGLWMLLYGTSMAAAGTLSVRPLLLMGLGFFLVGTLVLLFPQLNGDLLMAAAFGGLHILFGVFIARRYGG